MNRNDLGCACNITNAQALLLCAAGDQIARNRDQCMPRDCQEGTLEIRLDAPCEDIDLLALAERHPGIAILIIAPFEAPTRDDASVYESYVARRTALSHRWASTALLDEIEKPGTPVASRLLPLLIDLSMAPKDDQMKGMFFPWSPVRIWTLRNLSFTDASASLSDEQWQVLWSTPQSLPKHFLLGALRPEAQGKGVG